MQVLSGLKAVDLPYVSPRYDVEDAPSMTSVATTGMNNMYFPYSERCMFLLILSMTVCVSHHLPLDHFAYM